MKFVFWFLVSQGVSTPAYEPPPVIINIPRKADNKVVHEEVKEYVPPPDGPMCGPDKPFLGPSPTHLGVLLQDPITEEEYKEVDTQIQRCYRGTANIVNHFKQRGPNPFYVLALYRLEGELGIPEEYRGILGATWCFEASFRSRPKAGDEGRSNGPFQMMGVWWAKCNLPMTDNVMYNIPVAARCYWSNVMEKLEDGECPGNVFRAEAMIANGGYYKTKGCSAVSEHGKELLIWRGNNKVIHGKGVKKNADGTWSATKD